MTKDNIQTCEEIDVTVTFPAGAYQSLQFFDGDIYQNEEDLDENDTGRTWTTGFGINGNYSLYVRLWDGASWVYTETKAITVTAPNGPLTVDTGKVPAVIYEGDTASYQNNMVLYSSLYDEYAAAYIRAHMPKQKGIRIF